MIWNTKKQMVSKSINPGKYRAPLTEMRRREYHGGQRLKGNAGINSGIFEMPVSLRGNRHFVAVIRMKELIGR